MWGSKGQARPNIKIQPENGDVAPDIDPDPKVELEGSQWPSQSVLGTFLIEIRSCPACQGTGRFTVLNLDRWHKWGVPIWEHSLCDECSGKGAILTARRCG